jgi:hypothetical protein
MVLESLIFSHDTTCFVDDLKLMKFLHNQILVLKQYLAKKVILQVFQLIAGLYLSSQERPKTTGVDGDLMILNTMMLWYPYNTTSNGIVS